MPKYMHTETFHYSMYVITTNILVGYAINKSIDYFINYASPDITTKSKMYFKWENIPKILPSFCFLYCINYLFKKFFRLRCHF